VTFGGHATRCVARACLARSANGHRSQLTRCSVELYGMAVAYRRQGLHLTLPHRSLYEPRHQELDEMAEKRARTGNAVKAVATDDVEGGNGFKVRESGPSSASELHTSAVDIRQCLASNG
jgi:hypothetical protein